MQERTLSAPDPLAAEPKNMYYRPEIDGLRAFAVLAVIVNHVSKDLLPSGYLGVDMFFVISGYVITRSLHGRPSKDFKDFISGFYARRVKRLVPALIAFVLVISTLVSLFNPAPEEDLRIGITSLFGLSNIALFLASTDYFSQATELNPFTHTWSLGVEEQFYLVFPLLIWLTGFGQGSKNGAKTLLLTLCALTTASLCAFIYLYPLNQPAAYFLAPLRFWEMASGAIVFLILESQTSAARCATNIPPVMILTGIAGIMLLPLSTAVPATVGIVILSAGLIGCLEKESSIRQILTIQSLRYIGLISYSLYLWHWGALALMKITIGVSIYTIPLFAALTLAPAILSYEFIEKKLRRKEWSKSRGTTIALGVSSLAGSAAVVFLLQNSLHKHLFTGSTATTSNSQTAAKMYIGEHSGRKSQSCQNIIGTGISTQDLLARCSTNKPMPTSSSKIIIFTGDSHSGMLMPLSEMLYHNDKAQTADFFNDGCTIPELDIASGRCQNMDDQLISLSKRLKEKAIFVISSNFIGPDNFIRDTISLAKRATSYGSTLIVMLPNPTYPALAKGELVDKQLCKVQWYRPSFALGDLCADGFRINRQESLNNKERQYYKSRLAEFSGVNQKFLVYDPFEDLCIRDTPLDKSCSPYKGGTLLYYDDNHVNIDGAKVLYPRFRKFLIANKLIQQ